jgi:hypothetical protein
VVQNNTGASITDVELYNNLADGNPGGNATAWLYVNTAMNGVYIYNNVLVGGPYAIEGGFTGDQNYYILNNTIDCKGGSGTNVGPVNNFTIENNVLNNCYTYWSTHNITGNVSVNFNAYDSENSGSGHAFKWNGSTGGQTLAQYQASTGLDANSVNLANFDWSSYIPQSGSQLIAAATNLDGMDVTKLDSDKSGVVRPSPPAKWDAGAFQSSDSSGSTPNPPTGLSAQVQ